jgi:hypothetical protein
VRAFSLFQNETNFWSFSDYGAVVDTVSALGAKRILEFGPGSSTLALIEGGATSIDTCEDDQVWAEIYEERLVRRFPDIVHLHRYSWKLTGPIIPALDSETFDLALIDGPFETERRFPIIGYALQRCRSVLVPTEDAGRTNQSLFRPYLNMLAKNEHLYLEIRNTGPLSGGFALLTRPGC